jgi:hypothetical protein
MKFKFWNGENLFGKWIFTIKIDGVSAIKNDNGTITSKDNKPLYHIPNFDGNRAEIYCGSFKQTIQIVRSINHREIKPEEIYLLYPEIDKRLYINTVENPTSEIIKSQFNLVKSQGYEGLVLWSEDKSICYKVKDTLSEDVEIIGLIEGKGKNINKLGSFITSKGKVGTGLTDEERTNYFNTSMIGKIIEVKYMELTETGKFRHPRFYRLRDDK